MPDAVEMPYGGDSQILFEPMLEQPWSVWLDSAGCDRFDILACSPRATLVTQGAVTTVCDESGCRQSDEDPLTLVRAMLSNADTGSGLTLPFYGGAIGYFGYDLARRYERLPVTAADDQQLPEMAVGIYDWAVVVDHREQRCWLTGANAHAVAAGVAAYEEMLAAPRNAPEPFRVLAPMVSNIDGSAYENSVERIRTYLRAGDCYQVNFSQRFCAPASGDPFRLYRSLRADNPAPFSVYMNLPFVQIMSASPERFLHVKDGEVETRPIKGTRRRQQDEVQDTLVKDELRRSTKDQAENLMIVDLLRNDIGKSCEPGSVHVPELFAVETFATVHHLVSTVRGRLGGGKDALDLLRDCFPGGSITGAPKLRAMEIIEELETHRRGIYCGSIGYVGLDGAMDTNIVIRTLVMHEGRLCFSAGGGVVIDSVADAEYQESLDKAAALLGVVEKFRLS